MTMTCDVVAITGAPPVTTHRRGAHGGRPSNGRCAPRDRPLL